MRIESLETPFLFMGYIPIAFSIIFEDEEDYIYGEEIMEEWKRFVTPKKLWRKQRQNSTNLHL